MKFGPVSLLLLLSLGTCPSRYHQSGDRGELSDPWETLVRGLRGTIVDMVLTADVARVRSCPEHIHAPVTGTFSVAIAFRYVVWRTAASRVGRISSDGCTSDSERSLSTVTHMTIRAAPNMGEPAHLLSVRAVQELFGHAGPVPRQKRRRGLCGVGLHLGERLHPGARGSWRA